MLNPNHYIQSKNIKSIFKIGIFGGDFNQRIHLLKKCHDLFSLDLSFSYLGFSIAIKEINTRYFQYNIDTKIQIWNYSSDFNNDELYQLYIRGSRAIIIFVDLTDDSDIDQLSSTIFNIKSSINDCNIFVVGYRENLLENSKYELDYIDLVVDLDEFIKKVESLNAFYLDLKLFNMDQIFTLISYIINDLDLDLRELLRIRLVMDRRTIEDLIYEMIITGSLGVYESIVLSRLSTYRERSVLEANGLTPKNYLIQMIDQLHQIEIDNHFSLIL